MIQNKKPFASILFVLISFVCSAQTQNPPPPPPAGPSGPVGLPIDGGLIILFAAGFLYGIYKLYTNRRKVV
ncbi:PID-CTERM protein-sorting domain-containing protein [uncultured Lacinutrix sp.]|uniref:PID-CTERM protein-sorting domain-containing protein n=1 Tax=uncultured Lacinutrix sp. TaxID=574032 RepID=UPI00260BAB3A|nr:hypothetical protein [uncultured Lacinutrix sp.]